MANTLAYYDTATITAVKSFIVKATKKLCKMRLTGRDVQRHDYSICRDVADDDDVVTHFRRRHRH